MVAASKTETAVEAHEQAPTAWGRERIELIKRTICSPKMTNAEMELFIEQCRRTGLDPLVKQAFCVPRWVKVDGVKVERFEFQPSEAGMLARAEDFPDYAGTTSAAVHQKDTIKIDAGSGTVEHTFDPTQPRGSIIGAWARVGRHGRVAVVKWLRIEDYIQTYPDGKPSGQWKDRPATMIAKCAKVAALRDAFPRAFGGVYIEEEIKSDDSHQHRLAAVEAPRALAAPAKPETSSEHTTIEAHGEVVQPAAEAPADKQSQGNGQHSEQMAGFLKAIREATSTAETTRVIVAANKEIKDPALRKELIDAFNARNSELKSAVAS